MKSLNKSPNHLKKYYTIFLEVGIIGSLLIFIIATNINFTPSDEEYTPTVEKQEVITMEEVVKTEQTERPPPPPTPKVPVEVPNSAVIEEEILDINADFSLNETLEIPDPPKEMPKKQEEEEDFFVAVEQMPELIGSLSELKSNVQYPETARKAEIQGIVVVQFIVNEKGEVEKPRVIRGIGGGCDEEAIRVTKMAEFKPGKQRGEPVRVQYSMPFRFILKE